MCTPWAWACMLIPIVVCHIVYLWLFEKLFAHGCHIHLHAHWHLSFTTQNKYDRYHLALQVQQLLLSVMSSCNGDLKCHQMWHTMQSTPSELLKCSLAPSHEMPCRVAGKYTHTYAISHIALSCSYPMLYMLPTTYHIWMDYEAEKKLNQGANI